MYQLKNMLCAEISMTARNSATKTRNVTVEKTQHERHDGCINLPPAFGGFLLLLFAIGGLRLLFKNMMCSDKSCWRRVAKLDHGNEHEYDKNLAHLSTQQLTID